MQYVQYPTYPLCPGTQFALLVTQRAQQLVEVRAKKLDLQSPFLGPLPLFAPTLNHVAVQVHDLIVEPSRRFQTGKSFVVDLCVKAPGLEALVFEVLLDLECSVIKTKTRG